MQGLIDRIGSRQAVIGVVGLGVVGLTVATALAGVGFRVLGVDINAGLVASLAGGQHLVATTDFGPLAAADVVLIAVDTPVEADHRPDHASLGAACEEVGRVMKEGVLVVVESTVAPGTCADVVAPALAKASGRTLGAGFFLGHCPERVMPGRLLENLRELPRACGGASPETSEAMVALYGTIVRGRLDRCDLVTAELVKTAENAYRDVTIAFANELASLCEAAGADFPRVRELVNLSPGRAVPWAGAGVGGACIPKDPWLLVHAGAARPGSAEPRLIPAARAVNDAMPLHVARLAQEALLEADVTLRGARIAILGYSYLENQADTRGSPSRVLAEELVRSGAHVAIHDPLAAGCAKDLDATAAGASALVVMVAHDAYRRLDLPRLAALMATRVLVDGRFVVEPAAARAAGFVFRGVGRGA
jgi:UDP-N-acetyl-D-mannosaminuronic acid dehydrogenase